MTTLDAPELAPTEWDPPSATTAPDDDSTADVTAGAAAAPTDVDDPAGLQRSRVQRFLHGRPDDPAWVRPALLTLLVTTGVLYIWGLGASGWANDFYSAAVQAGTKSWKAFFFGSSDSANFITVDKPPASLWVMELSARIFGVNSWSILVPQALEGVAAVGVLYLAVRRWFGAAAGLIAGAVMALTPVAVLMFRFNNPDALLVLLMVGAAYFTTRAIEDGKTKWLVWAGVLLGFGFLAKMLQSLAVLPALALAYLIAGPPQLGKRIWQLLVGGVAMIAAAGWWVAIVELWPADSRPYIGGSTNNSVLDLVFGYNGFGRLTGNETGSVVGGGGPGGAGAWGPTGWTRLFNSSWGGQASWLIPAALLFAVVGLVLAGIRNRHDRIRSAVIIWGGWLFVTGALFSLSKGIIHEYYSVALAPAIGALVGIGITVLWALRNRWWARGAMAASVALTGWWSYTLLNRTPDWYPWLRVTVVVAAALAVVGLVIGRRAAGFALGAAAVAALLGPTAYSLSTVSTASGGSLPSAGPAVPGAGFGPGRGGAGRPTGGFPGGVVPGGVVPGGVVPGGQQGFPGGQNGGGFPPLPPGGGDGLPTIPGAGTGNGNGQGAFPGGNGRPGGGNFLDANAPSTEVVQFLQDGKAGYTYALATIGANNAAGYQLATDDPVMAIGGFNGTDQWPTLEGFQQMVTDGKIHYFVAGGGFPGGGGGAGGTASTSSQISSWVQANFATVTVGNVTFYDLSQPTG